MNKKRCAVGPGGLRKASSIKPYKTPPREWGFSLREDCLESLEPFSAVLQVLPFDAVAVREAGKLRQHLRERTTPIGDMDMLIAAHALSVNAIVVTNNVKEFAPVPTLKIENWLK